jgi:hypothetical protein
LIRGWFPPFSLSRRGASHHSIILNSHPTLSKHISSSRFVIVDPLGREGSVENKRFIGS